MFNVYIDAVDMLYHAAYLEQQQVLQEVQYL